MTAPARERLLPRSRVVLVLLFAFMGWLATASLVQAPQVRAAALVQPDPHAIPEKPLPSSHLGSVSTPLLTERGDEAEWSNRVITEYAHENEPWAADLMANLQRSPHRDDAILGSVPLDSERPYANIVDNRRVSYQPSKPLFDVWFFGGSTMYGVGQRDHQTIPSVIARLAEVDGIPIRVLNFGVSADVNWQETERLAHALGSGLPTPDLVVFYDGLNDTGLGSQRVREGDVDFNWVRWAPVSDDQRDAFSRRTEVTPIADEDRRSFEVRHTAGQYARGVALGRSMAAAWDFEITHFWQPHLGTKPPGIADIPLFDRLGFDQTAFADRKAQSKDTLVASGTGAIDVSDVFDEVDVPIYFDHGHTNEFGAWLVAQRLYDHLHPDLERLAASIDQ